MLAKSVCGLFLISGFLGACSGVPRVQPETVSTKPSPGNLRENSLPVMQGNTILDERLKSVPKPGQKINLEGRYEGTKDSLNNYAIQYSGEGVLPVILHNDKQYNGKYAVVNYDISSGNKKLHSLFETDLSNLEFEAGVLKIPFQFSGTQISIRCLLLEDGRQIGDIKIRNELTQNGQMVFRDLQKPPVGVLRMKFLVIDDDF
jgi:hypothetical protein